MSPRPKTTMRLRRRSAGWQMRLRLFGLIGHVALQGWIRSSTTYRGIAWKPRWRPLLFSQRYGFEPRPKNVLLWYVWRLTARESVDLR